MSVLQELDLLDCAGVLAGGGIRDIAGVAAAGVDGLAALGLKAPHAKRIAIRVASTEAARRRGASSVPEFAVAGHQHAQNELVLLCWELCGARCGFGYTPHYLVPTEPQYRAVAPSHCRSIAISFSYGTQSGFGD